LVSVGRSVVESQPGTNIYASPMPDKTERKKEKQKILDKLEELERIQKFNEEKLMKDLEQLEKKNQGAGGNRFNPMKKKVTSVSPPSTGEKRTGINYEDKIREL
jgi:hypothetical protein